MKITSFPSAGLNKAGIPSEFGRSAMSFLLRVTAGVALAITALATELQASDPIGIYAFVDKVVFEPSTGTPERIQVWGGFALAEGRGDAYTQAKRGFLYLEIPPDDPTLARNEWNDLKALAGTGQIVGFGNRHKQLPKVRDPKAEVKDADRYPLGFGLIKVRSEGRRADYPPTKQLRALQETKDKTSTSSAPGKAATSTKGQE